MNDYEKMKEMFITFKIKFREENTLEQKMITLYQSNWWRPTNRCVFYFWGEAA